VTSEDVRGYWDGEAARFDDEPDHGLRDAQVRAAWDRLLREHLPPAPADVLDLGCGTGSLTLLLAQGGHRVHGVDLAPGMVTAATAKLTAAGVAASVEVGDASDPPGRPESYDVVLTRHVLWALPDPSAALSRWVRLLRQGGRLLLVEGRWWTGGGLTSAETQRLLRPYASQVLSVPLTDPVLWGRPVDDERYLVVAVPSA
jgi:ubiquinone/menaquinone biosynthesis C-methylase UbiE